MQSMMSCLALRKDSDEHDATLGVVKANTACLEALECLVNGVTGDVKNLQREVDQTRSDVEGIMGSV